MLIFDLNFDIKLTLTVTIFNERDSQNDMAMNDMAMVRNLDFSLPTVLVFML